MPDTRSNGTFPEDDEELIDPDEDEADDDFTPDDEDEDEDALEGDEDDSLLTEDEVTKSTQDLAKLRAKVKEYESRIGKLVQSNDERLKKAEADWTSWGENYKKWADEQIRASYTRGKEEAEELLLRQLDPESKAEYFESTRQSDKQRREAAEDARRKAAQSQQSQQAQIQAQVNKAVSEGVPVEVLDQSSPEAVMNSVVQYFKGSGGRRARTPQDPEEDSITAIRRELEETKDELKRVKRDSSGASRTGTSVGGSSPRVNSRLREIDEEIAKAKRQHNISAVLALKRQRNALTSGQGR